MGIDFIRVGEVGPKVLRRHGLKPEEIVYSLGGNAGWCQHREDLGGLMGRRGNLLF